MKVYILTKRKIMIAMVIIILFMLGTLSIALSQELEKGECFYLLSLHATAKGMAYWYDTDQGGLETITGVPYAEVGCSKCHVNSCDACHKTKMEGKPVYSTKAARNQEVCFGCHARELQMMMKIDKSANTPDVHLNSGMSCMDCHTAREMHGDSIEYNSMKQIGAMDVKCEQCHEGVTQSISHTTHGEKLDCKACHVRHVVSCTNCHFETMIKEKRRVALPISGWKYLMNYNGKVTSANMQTFVVPGNKTFLMFAPQFSHSVKKEGDKCEECHATNNVNQILKNKIDLTWLEEGKVQQIRGIIPVVDGVQYNSVYQNYENKTWTPIPEAVPPKVQYVGYGSPLTKEQLSKLAKPQKESK
jgi:hypothetical protein